MICQWSGWRATMNQRRITWTLTLDCFEKSAFTNWGKESVSFLNMEKHPAQKTWQCTGTDSYLGISFHKDCTYSTTSITRTPRQLKLSPTCLGPHPTFYSLKSNIKTWQNKAARYSIFLKLSIQNIVSVDCPWVCLRINRDIK